jgi:hypothetical protein
MFDTFDFYEKMENGRILLSFKGEVTSDLLSSMLKVMESKLESISEEPKTKKKVYNVLVECLQNLYHHKDLPSNEIADKNSTIFLIGLNNNGSYKIITGNYISDEGVKALKTKIDMINGLSKVELKQLYIDTLTNENFSEKGGGGLGIIDIARKSGNKIEYQFVRVENGHQFFSMIVNV